MDIVVKRIYEPALVSDGKRILVDRLWPRGISKERAQIDIWNKDITPSPDLRKWFGHKEENFKVFSHNYRQELINDSEKIQAVKDVLDLNKENKITLLYAARSEIINHAVILRDYLNEVKQGS